MKVLVACEFSQVVTRAFRERGHKAYSCDILPTEGNPDWHIHDDVFKHLADGWDLMVAHWECRYMANSGVRWLHEDIGRWFKLFEAAENYNKLKAATIPRIAMESSIFHKYAIALCGRQDQVVQPWWFEEKESKGIGLQLKNLPKLTREVYTKPKDVRQSVWRMPPSEARAKERARFLPGVARAMAEQWGSS